MLDKKRTEARLTFRYAQYVVVHVAEVGLEIATRDRELAAREPSDGRGERSDRAVELEHLALEAEDAPGRVGPLGGEDLLLDLLDVAFEPVGDRAIVVHDLVHDRVQHRSGTVCEQLGLLVQFAAHVAERARLTVPNRHDEGLVDEQDDLARLDQLCSSRCSAPASGRPGACRHRARSSGAGDL